MNSPIDLRREPPRSPHERVGGYAILARTIDKCRAVVAGQVGDYHFNCPLDQMFFAFKDVAAADLQRHIESGASDEQIVTWLEEAGAPKTPAEIEAWSKGMETVYPYDDPERRSWFIEQCGPLGLDPVRTTLFDYLDADDRASFAEFAHRDDFF
jgi:hypothetical protein